MYARTHARTHAHTHTNTHTHRYARTHALAHTHSPARSFSPVRSPSQSSHNYPHDKASNTRDGERTTKLSSDTPVLDLLSAHDQVVGHPCKPPTQHEAVALDLVRARFDCVKLVQVLPFLQQVN